ncbi:hypothetical protein [Candidatus Binatus sp.]|uniref:hypothetical protein n=1 Tax=Candidatus Binatus sp. TaxID=2811406 RepID=UPI003BAF99BA
MTAVTQSGRQPRAFLNRHGVLSLAPRDQASIGEFQILKSSFVARFCRCVKDFGGDIVAVCMLRVTPNLSAVVGTVFDVRFAELFLNLRNRLSWRQLSLHLVCPITGSRLIGETTSSGQDHNRDRHSADWSLAHFVFFLDSLAASQVKSQDRVGSFIPSTATLNFGYAREKGIPIGRAVKAGAVADLADDSAVEFRQQV